MNWIVSYLKLRCHSEPFGRKSNRLYAVVETTTSSVSILQPYGSFKNDMRGNQLWYCLMLSCQITHATESEQWRTRSSASAPSKSGNIFRIIEITGCTVPTLCGVAQPHKIRAACRECQRDKCSTRLLISPANTVLTFSPDCIDEFGRTRTLCRQRKAPHGCCLGTRIGRTFRCKHAGLHLRERRMHFRYRTP